MSGPYDLQILVEIPRPRVSESQLKKNTRKILKEAGLKKGALSLVLTSDAGIRKLNKKYLGHDWATDVIAFSHLEGIPLKSATAGLPFLGDIAISLQTTQKQATLFKNSFYYELYFYICHGILHLTGWKDSTLKKRALMLAHQTRILKRIGVA